MRRREIVLELTALLDVILIMLFVLLTQAGTQASAAVEAAEADRAALEAARAELEAVRRERDEAAERADALEREVLTENLVLEESLVITLSAERGGTIRVESAEGRETIPYNWDDDTYASNALRAHLLGLVRSTERRAVFIVFQFDRAAIYRTEYAMIGKVVREVKLEARERDIPLSYMELDISQT